MQANGHTRAELLTHAFFANESAWDVARRIKARAMPSAAGRIRNRRWINNVAES
jgi:hypothetical protein